VKLRAALALAFLMVLALPVAASASWQGASSGAKGYVAAKSMPAGNTPMASVSNRSVTVSWTSPSGGAPVSGYIVKRYNNSGTLQTIGSACSGTVAGTSCIETGVPAGAWKYSVTPANQNWRGAESSQSSSVTVSSPSLSLSGTTISSLPSTLSGSIANFIPGQTVAYRLDNPTSGTVLTGSINPTPVQNSGSATVSVTIPVGTSNGSHTVYAIGSSGDQASAAITVAVPQTFTTTGWSLTDASSGSASDQSAGPAFTDGILYTSLPYAAAFASNRYIDFRLNGPINPNASVSSVNFNFRFAAEGNNETDCFYLEARRISTDAVVGTYGSSGSPAGCNNSGSKDVQQDFSISMPAVNSATIANDLYVRVYGNSSGNKTSFLIDKATVSGTAGGNSFTLYPNSLTDNADAGSNAATPWELFALGGTGYTSTNNWPNATSTSKYLQVGFPGYVPSGATISSVSFKHSYVQSGGGNVCYYFDVIASGSTIGTHGSSGSPVSCNSSAILYQTDIVPLPEVTTVAQANNLAVRMYVTSSTVKKSTDDQDVVTVTYVP
jgi:hypothetical protein